MAHELGIIGGGNMGAAIVRGCVAARVLKAPQIIVAEVDLTRRRALAELGCATTDHAPTAAAAEQLLLAVKPQIFPEVARTIAPLADSKIVISIMAGLSSPAIRSALGGHARVVRAMPNMPCQIGAGMTAIALGEGARRGDESLTLSIFSALGKTANVDESLLFAVTAVSGSGPAYVFLLAEAMQAAAIEMGLDESTAQLLVEQTVMGAGKLLSESEHDAAALRTAVTSPGGTTAAALSVFRERQFTPTVIDALLAARNRGMELDSNK